MTSFTDLLQQGSSHAWLFFPSAVLLGALHGLEPGHSKTMMAAFIIAIRGTIVQAVLLGLSAAISHSLLVWLIAAAGMYYGNEINPEKSEPYFQLVSAVIIAGMALWMFWRTRRDVIAAQTHHHHHGHEHGEEVVINTGHSEMKVAIFEEGIPPVFRLTFFRHGKAVLPDPNEISVETIRPDGASQMFSFVKNGEFLQSTTDIPEPHEFKIKLGLKHGNHSHYYDAQFSEHEHHHDYDHENMETTGVGFQDAHEKAHASDIERRFAGRTVTTGQIVLFGITGGLMPCPAAITILLICLQLKQFTLGFALVLAFSFGLAVTMVTVGAVAAWSVHHAEKRFSGFGEFMRKAPYFSVVILLLLSSYIGWQALRGLHIL
jgi:nickel/cobalt exporter